MYLYLRKTGDITKLPNVVTRTHAINNSHNIF